VLELRTGLHVHHDAGRDPVAEQSFGKRARFHAALSDRDEYDLPHRRKIHGLAREPQPIAIKRHLFLEHHICIDRLIARFRDAQQRTARVRRGKLVKVLIFIITISLSRTLPRDGRPLSHRFSHCCVPIAREELHQSLIDAFDRHRAAEDEPGNYLHERRTRLDLLVRILGGEHASEADQDIFPARLLIDVPDHGRGKLFDRSAGDASLRDEVEFFLRRAQVQNTAILRKVAQHESVNEVIFIHDRKDRVHLVHRKMRGELQEYRTTFASRESA